MPRHHGHLDDEDATEAAWEAGRGAIVGAAKWGIASAALAAAGYAMSPIYRSLTVQFKAYLQMSGMAFGATVDAERRLRDFQARKRLEAKLARDRATWDNYEAEYGEGTGEE